MEILGHTLLFWTLAMITVEPPLMATFLQWPLFLSRQTKNPYIDSCLKPLYSSPLFTMVALFCPQVGHCRELQLQYMWEVYMLSNLQMIG